MFHKGDIAYIKVGQEPEKGEYKKVEILEIKRIYRVKTKEGPEKEFEVGEEELVPKIDESENMYGYYGPPFHEGDVAYIRNNPEPGKGAYSPVEILKIKEVEGKRICKVRTLWEKQEKEFEVEEKKLASGFEVWD